MDWTSTRVLSSGIRARRQREEYLASAASRDAVFASIKLFRTDSAISRAVN